MMAGESIVEIILAVVAIYITYRVSVKALLLTSSGGVRIEQLSDLSSKRPNVFSNLRLV